MPYVWILTAENEDRTPQVWVYSSDNHAQAVSDAKRWMGEGYFMTLSKQELITPGMTQEDAEYHQTWEGKPMSDCVCKPLEGGCHWPECPARWTKKESE